MNRWRRIIPAAFVMYTIAYIDRTNFSLAIPALQADLSLSSQYAGIAAGVFFFGYFIFQVPGGHLAQKWSARKYIFWALLAWGAFATLCGLAQSVEELLVYRFCLGLAEGGVWPATMVLLSNWFPREERARASGYWVLCQPVAIVVSNPISGWLLDHYSWRVMFVAEGLLPVVFAPLWWWAVKDNPAEAPWVKDQERLYLKQALQQEQESIDRHESKRLWGVLSDSNIMLFIVLDICFACGAYGLLMWLPTAIHSFRSSNNMVVGILSALPYLAACFGSVYNSRHSDLKHERRLHVAIPCVVAGLCLMLGALWGGTFPGLSLLLLCITGGAVYAAIGPMWALLTEVLPRHSAGIALGLVNGMANLGGFVGPYLVGMLRDRTQSFFPGFVFLSLSLGFAGLLTLLVRQPAYPSQTEVTLHTSQFGVK